MWEIGQKVVCINNKGLDNVIREGYVYSVEGNNICCHCGFYTIDVGKKGQGNMQCGKCDIVTELMDERRWFRNDRFKPYRDIFIEETEKQENEKTEK